MYLEHQEWNTEYQSLLKLSIAFFFYGNPSQSKPRNGRKVGN